MTTSFKKLPNSAIELSALIPLKDLKTETEREFARAKAGLEVKGFRKGMAPEAIAREAISHKKLFDAATETLIKRSLHEAAEENAWTIIDRPVIEIKDDSTSLSYSAKFSIYPEVNLEGWKKIAEAERIELAKRVEKITAPDHEVSQAVEWLREARAELQPTTEPAKQGMVIDIALTSSVDKKPHEDRFILGKGRFMAGLEDKLMGHAVGETMKFLLTAPADYWKEDLRGKEISFTAEIKGLFNRILPDANDAFAAASGTFKTMGELKNSIKEGIILEKKEREEEASCIKILETLTDEANIEIPTPMLERMKSSVKEEEKTLKRRIATHLVIYTLAEKVDARPSEEEVEKGVALYKGEIESKSEIDQKELHGYIYERIQQKKVYAKLLNTDGN